jgi:hypothetical protein
MKNFTRLITLGLALIGSQQISAEEITNKDWLLQQGNEYIREALINLDLPVMTELKRLDKPAAEQKTPPMLAKNESKRLTATKTSASE